MPPAKTRDQYVIGKLGSYACPTVTAVDKCLARLAQEWAAMCSRDPAAAVMMAGRYMADVDKLLDHRMILTSRADSS